MGTYTKQQAKDSDAILAEHQKQLYTAMDHLNSVSDWVLSLSGATRVRTGRSSFWSFDGKSWATLDAAESRLRERMRTGQASPHGNVSKALEKLNEGRSRVALAQGTVDARESAWNENGRWTRYFAVSGGHIHSSAACHSLRPTTRIGWLPELSAESEEEAVTRYGSVLCTFCFPSAPVGWTTGTMKTEAQERRAGKPAPKKLEEVLDPATSEPLLDTDGRILKTERAASNALVDALFCLLWYGNEHPEASAWISYSQRAVPALAALRGVSEADVRAEYDRKAQKKHRRESR